MDNTLPQTIGIDISKATLDVYAYPAGSERQFTNTVRARELLAFGHDLRLMPARYV